MRDLLTGRVRVRWKSQQAFERAMLSCNGFSVESA